MSAPRAVQEAARRLGCRVNDLLAWRVLKDGGVVVIAPDGRKVRFCREALSEPSTNPTPVDPKGCAS